MHELLLAENVYNRLKADFDALDGITCVTLNSDSEFRRGGELVEMDALNISMVRLDMDLFGTNMKTLVGLLSSTEKFSFIQTAAAGIESPLFPPLVKKSDVFCKSNAQAPAVAEFAVASVMNYWHQFHVRREHQQNNKWQNTTFKQVLGTNWLVIGFGNIGEILAQQVKGFGASVTAVRRNPAANEFADQVVTLEEAKEHLPKADVVVLCCAVNDETRNLADAAFFKSMKSDAVIVNIGRGELLDDAALLEALDGGELEHAILDVFREEPLPAESPFWNHEHVQLTPHSSYMGSQLTPRFDALFMSNLKAYLAGQPVSNQVPKG